MNDTRHSDANDVKVAQLQRAIEELLRLALRRGFHGQVGVELAVQDGTIQHIRRRCESLEK